MATERHRVFFAGNVQGVGFRMTTREFALDRPIVGFARNRDDGRVELLIEGDSTALTDLVRAIERYFGSSIRDRTVMTEPVGVPPLRGFVIH